MNYDGVKVCSVPDNVGNVSCQWHFPNVAVYAEGMLGGVNMVDAVEQALAIWNRVCGINLKMAANRSVAHIVIDRGSIDGPNGTLAWSELPCGFTKSQWRQLQQKYDTGEMWTIAENPPGGKIDAVRVIAHELGHALGVQHLAMGNLMAPTYSTSIRYPQNGDITEMLARYGKPVEAAPPAPVPTVPVPVPPTAPTIPGVPGGELIMVDEKGKRWKYVGFVPVQ